MLEQRSLRQKARRIVENSYGLSTVKQIAGSHFSPAWRSNPLIVYQMGKVGSEALEASLLACELQRPLYRVHAMVKENIDIGLMQANVTSKEYFKRSKTDFIGLHLGNQIRRDLRKHKWQVVTMVRDPVAQNVSTFFQIMDLLVSNYSERLARKDISIEELSEKFLELFPPDNIFVNWFDKELGKLFEVDVFEKPFDKEKGVSRWSWPNLDLLVIRLEDFDQVASTELQKFIDIDGFEIKKKNLSSTKIYHDLYTKFRTEASFPEAYLDGVYGSRLARHFYTNQELASFRSAWKSY